MKLFQNKYLIELRNKFNFFPKKINFNNLSKNNSISDAFPWRVDNNFVTKINFTNLPNFFLNSKSFKSEIHIYSNKNKFLKKIEFNNKTFQSFIISKTDIEKIEKNINFGSFYIFHKSQETFETNVSFRNSCYVGFSKNNSFFSYVHGNTPVKYSMYNSNKIQSGLVERSFSIFSSRYSLQENYDDYDFTELFIINPTNKKIFFKINKKRYELEEGYSTIINSKKESKITLNSNCLFLRPVIFNYRQEFFDVHHG